MQRKPTRRSHRGILAALSGAAALVTGLAGEMPARGAPLPDHMPRSVLPAKERGLALADRNRVIAVPLIVESGWSYHQYKCLDRLWTRESGWNHRARNPGTGAYGIPQALPAGKMASAGADWRTNAATQIKWGLDYIKDRYGNPCSAWDHLHTSGWY